MNPEFEKCIKNTNCSQSKHMEYNRYWFLAWIMWLKISVVLSSFSLRVVEIWFYSQPVPSSMLNCCWDTEEVIESGQKRCRGRVCGVFFLVLGTSVELASSIGCRIRLRALMNLYQTCRDGFKSVNETKSMKVEIMTQYWLHLWECSCSEDVYLIFCSNVIHRNKTNSGMV